jgi:phosphoribosylglycinamide formyltransferase-1
VLDTWKTTSACRHGSGERYVRKHWARIRTADGTVMTLYFERQARSRRELKTRWWLYTIDTTNDAKNGEAC